MLCFENIGTNSIKEMNFTMQMFYLDILHKGADAMEEAHCEIPKLISLYLYFQDVAQPTLPFLTNASHSLSVCFLILLIRSLDT